MIAVGDANTYLTHPHVFIALGSIVGGFFLSVFIAGEYARPELQSRALSVRDSAVGFDVTGRRRFYKSLRADEELQLLKK